MNTSKPQAGPIRRIIRPFLAGIFAIFPLVLTFTIVLWLGGVIHGLMGPGSSIGKVLREIGIKFATSETAAYLIGLAIGIGAIYLLGLFVQGRLKKRWEALADRVLMKVPVVSTIYDASKKISQMIEPQDALEMKSMKPVLCHFGPGEGTAFPAFLPTQQMLRMSGRDYHVVMIPTAPMLFGGAILCVPKEKVTPLNCGIDGIFNIYMSMGVKMPDYFDRDEENIEVVEPGEPDRAASDEPA